MKFRAIALVGWLCASAFLLAGSSASWQTEGLRSNSAGNFLNIPEATRTTFVVGMDAGFTAGAYMQRVVDGGSEGELFLTTWLLECTKNMSSMQKAQILSNYLRDHPEDWSQPIGLYYYAAIREVCSQKLNVVPGWEDSKRR